jgi:hypothetical protein
LILKRQRCVDGESGRNVINGKLVLAIVYQIPLDLKVRKPESTLLALRLQKRPLESLAYSARANSTVRKRGVLWIVHPSDFLGEAETFGPSFGR